jgi:hypothetical protein
MHLGERRMRGKLRVSLAGIGTGKDHPYRPPVRPARTTAPSNTFTLRRWCRDLRHTAPQNRETLPHIRSKEGTLEKTTSEILRGSLEDPRHHPLHHQPLHHQRHSPPTIVVQPSHPGSSLQGCEFGFLLFQKEKDSSIKNLSTHKISTH